MCGYLKILGLVKVAFLLVKNSRDKKQAHIFPFQNFSSTCFFPATKIELVQVVRKIFGAGVK